METTRILPPAPASQQDFLADGLPVEMVCLILRSLDSESLDRAVLAHDRWWDAAMGDPILRRRLRKRARRQRRERIAAPEFEVLRPGAPGEMFGKNITRTLRQTPTPHGPSDLEIRLANLPKKPRQAKARKVKETAPARAMRI